MSRFRMIPGQRRAGREWPRPVGQTDTGRTPAETPAANAPAGGDAPSDATYDTLPKTVSREADKAGKAGEKGNDKVAHKLAAAEARGAGVRARIHLHDPAANTPAPGKATARPAGPVRGPVHGPQPGPQPTAAPDDAPGAKGASTAPDKAASLPVANDQPARRVEAGVDPLVEPTWRARGPMLAGVLAVGLLVGGFGVWSVGTQIAGAVVAPGRIQVDSNRQVVQHPQGGVVGQILAKDGDHVAAGDVLLKLDGSRTRSELSIVESQLRDLAASSARLRAERDGSDTVAVSADTPAWIRSDAEFERQLVSERKLFTARSDAITQQARLIDEQNAQIGNRVTGTEAELASANRQAALLDDAIGVQDKLLKQGLTESSRLLQLRTQRETLAGQTGQLTAQIAELKGQLAANDIQKLQLTTKRREEAMTQLREIQFKEVELSEKRLALKDTLSRLDIRAPVSGIVYDSKVFAVKSVVQAAEPLMYIIPQDRPLIVQARVESTQIDDIHVGQKVSLRFPAFDQRTTPPISGTVTRISADTLIDPATHASFYAATVIPDADGLAQLGAHRLVPGMPVEAFIETGERSPLTYLMHPLAVYFDKAFRE